MKPASNLVRLGLTAAAIGAVAIAMAIVGGARASASQMVPTIFVLDRDDPVQPVRLFVRGTTSS